MSLAARSLQLAAALALLAALAPAVRAERVPSEYEVKAVFLYNFAKFVEWPAGAFARTDGAVVLGVFGDDPFGVALDRIARQQNVKGRRIVIRRGRSLEELGHVHVLFVNVPDDASSLPKFIRAASTGHRLVVGDSEYFASRGGAVGFFVEKQRVRFVVNLGAIDRAGLKMSSKLLAIAKVIRS